MSKGEMKAFHQDGNFSVDKTRTGKEESPIEGERRRSGKRRTKRGQALTKKVAMSLRRVNKVEYQNQLGDLILWPPL